MIVKTGKSVSINDGDVAISLTTSSKGLGPFQASKTSYDDSKEEISFRIKFQERGLTLEQINELGDQTFFLNVKNVSDKIIPEEE